MSRRPGWARRDPGPLIAAVIAGVFAGLVLGSALLLILQSRGVL